MKYIDYTADTTVRLDTGDLHVVTLQLAIEMAKEGDTDRVTLTGYSRDNWTEETEYRIHIINWQLFLDGFEERGDARFDDVRELTGWHVAKDGEVPSFFLALAEVVANEINN